jgi:iron complex transport system substrate-binding protein
LWLVAALAAAAVLSAQAQGAPPPAPAKGGAETAEVRDELGRQVRLPLAPQRIVSLAPSLTETLFALELGDRVVGVTNYCDYPPEARTRPRVGGPINPNLEQIVSLHPDVVLATRALNRRDTVEALDRLGLAVYTTDPRTVEDVIASTRRLGKVLGAQPRAEALAATLEHRLAELQRRLAGHTPKRVFFIVWTAPLISVGPHTFLADALQRAGAQSVVESSQDWPVLSIEEVLRQNPDFLVMSGAHPDDARSTLEDLRQRPGWRSLEAVRQGRFAIVSDALNRPSPRLIDAIEELARQLHPEALADELPGGATVPKRNPTAGPAVRPDRRHDQGPSGRTTPGPAIAGPAGA